MKCLALAYVQSILVVNIACSKGGSDLVSVPVESFTEIALFVVFHVI